MRSDHLRQAESIFQELADLPVERRGAALAERCAGDEELHALVEGLFKNDEVTCIDWLRTPVFAGAADPAPVPVALPQQIGRYEIVRLIGSGGMGVVYEARQAQPNRTVALKIIRSGMPSAAMLRRFQLEAEVLGQLHHPGIAHIYEAATATIGSEDGATDRLPYLAMEFIRGKPLNEHSDNEILTSRQRLALLAKICDAVEHAHQKGVIHRDLKPGNILVDESGQPKVLDFGVARATEAGIGTLAAQTGAGQLMGTLPYMSPEQVAGDSGQLDTRSDVYALGVIAYELLAGALPLDVRDLPMPEAARRIRDEEPASLASIDRTLRGEIETIVARAIEKNKERRYQSASDLASDIRRHLRGEAIEAKRDSAFYVLRKTVARYRGLAAGGTLIVLLLATFGVVSFIQARRNRQLADGLQATLIANNIERGRLFTRTGHMFGAEDLIWREHLTNPTSKHSYWALWELYSQNPSLATFVGHERPLRNVRFAPDGLSFVTGSVSDTVRIWNARTFQPIVALEGHSAGVYSVAYSPDGRWIASASMDGTVKIWNAVTTELAHTLLGHDGSVAGVGFAADSSLVVSGGYDGTVRVWDVHTGECVNVLTEHEAPVLSIHYNPQDQVLVTGSKDGVVKLWRDLTRPSITTLTRGAHELSGSVISPDGRMLAATGVDKLVTLWHLDDSSHVETLGAPNNGTVKFLTFGLDGNTLFSGGWFRIEQWDLATRRSRPVVAHGAVGGAINPDGRTLVSGWGGGDIRVTDIQAHAGLIRLGGNSNVGVASISPDGNMVACGDATNHVRVWEIATGKLMKRLQSPTSRWSSCHFHPSGTKLAACGADGMARMWDIGTSRCVRTVDDVHVATGQALSFSSDGRLMAVTRPDETIQLLAVETGDVMTTLPSMGSEALGVRFGPNGSIIATTHRGNTVALWTMTGTELGTLDIGVTPWSVDFDPGAGKLAVGCWDHEFQIWDIETRTLEARVGAAKMVSWGIAYRPTDAHIVATSSGDGGVRLWDLTKRRNVLTLEEFGGADALSVSFTPDGKTLVSAGYDGSLCVWDLEYYDRHIVGNLEYQMERLRDDLEGRIQTATLRAWAEDVLRRKWPRIGPRAR